MRKTSQLGCGAIALAAMLAMAVAPAGSQSGNNNCAPRDNLVNQLGHQYSENQQAIGLLDDKAIMEVFVSRSGTWTILITDTSGTSCIIAAGEGWDDSFAITARSQGA